ncbi:hypothetical protein [Deinococcus sp. AJ005]|uniref:hypothetical protein n=1 Tax=Deinococcus sp. AJ005 TaxID=2652443 RepID=UPI00125CB137|nr:hypothetical protein [Deinococcus sp. AJ005]QFP75897.1 hypothetical protein DAAJ005_05080 [Deinococcus sp. AJ005]
MFAPTQVENCTQPPVFSLWYESGNNYVLPRDRGFKFSGNAWLKTRLCSGGLIKITADGELAGSEHPRLIVAFDNNVILNSAFDQQRTIQLLIPRAGYLYIAYFNDYYLADIRIVNLAKIQLKAPNCRGFQNVSIPKESGGTWFPKIHAASLVKPPPMILTPCDAGELTLKVRGQEANAIFPVLVIKQNEKVIKTIFTGSGWEDLNLQVAATPITIAVSNPYNETLADRNLNVRRIEFIPRQP